MTKIRHDRVSEHPFPNDPSAAAMAVAAYQALAPAMRAQLDQMVDWIMKNCLWQFHSRAWDRKRQNAGILGITEKLLCAEPYQPDSPEMRCYWVDAVTLARAYRSGCPWLAGMPNGEIHALMRALHQRLDYLTITGSLNEELTDEHY